MKEIFDLLNRKERRALLLLCFLAVAALTFYFTVAAAERNTYFRSRVYLSEKQKDLQNVILNREEKKHEWLKWEETCKDMIELKEKHFYSEDEGIKLLRNDLQRIFNESRVWVSPIKYDYSEFEKEKIKKVKISFVIAGSYFSLKKFIHYLEEFPKFLVIEKIDFPGIDSQGRQELRISLAGYYES